MLFTIEALPALEGDSLLLHWGTATTPHLAVVDGGPGRTYEDSLRPRLEEIANNRDLTRLPIELVMVSHVDADHIVGIKKLFARMKKEVEQTLPADQRLLEVARLWHNTFNDVLGDSIDKYYKQFTSSFTASVGDGRPAPETVKALKDAAKVRHNLSEEDAAREATDIALLLAGHADGRTLRDVHKFLHEKSLIAGLNSPFKDGAGHARLISSGVPAIGPIQGLSVTVLGPLHAELQALQAHFDEFITQKGLTAEAVLAAYADKSPTNLSSIVCLAERGGKTVLLTGDARGDKILQGLRDAGLLDSGKMNVDVLKVPHHGSSRNVDIDFFKSVIADHYIFSGNGKHGNPDRETMQMLIDARGPDAVFDIHLTYPVADVDAVRKADAEGKGHAWTPAKHALKSFFAARSAEGFKFGVHAAPVKVDLGTERIAW